MTRTGKRRATSLLGALAAALPLAGAAAADREQIHLTGPGQAVARAAVVHRADLGGAAGWTGGVKKPDLTSGTGCAGFNPKQSDLVLIGAAETVFKQPGVEFDSEAQVLETPAMVRLDWQRTVLAPQVMPCLRSNLAHQLTSAERLVSLRRIAFPPVAAYTRAYRATVAVKTAAGTARVLVDLALLGHANVEITLTTTAPLAAASAVRGAELRLARVLVGRVPG